MYGLTELQVINHRPNVNHKVRITTRHMQSHQIFMDDPEDFAKMLDEYIQPPITDGEWEEKRNREIISFLSKPVMVNEEELRNAFGVVFSMFGG